MSTESLPLDALFTHSVHRQLTESEGPPDDDYLPPSASGHSRQRSSTPLLSNKVDKPPTSFPMPQMLLLLVLAVAEPIHATQIYPYLAQVSAFNYSWVYALRYFLQACRRNWGDSRRHGEDRLLRRIDCMSLISSGVLST